MHTLYLVVASIVLSMLGAPPDGTQQLNSPEPPPPSLATIDLVTVNGSGCPPGSTAITVAPDSPSFTVSYRDFVALVGVGARSTDNRKSCQAD